MLLMVVMVSLPSLLESAPAPAPTTILVDLIPLALGTSLILKGKIDTMVSRQLLTILV